MKQRRKITLSFAVFCTKNCFFRPYERNLEKLYGDSMASFFFYDTREMRLITFLFVSSGNQPG